jgi:hypothetical protein
MKNKVLILASILFLMVGFFLVQIFGVTSAFVNENNHDMLANLIENYKDVLDIDDIEDDDDDDDDDDYDDDDDDDDEEDEELDDD